MAGAFLLVLAVLSAIGIVLAAALAIAVVRADPRRRANRLLAGVLLLQAALQAALIARMVHPANEQSPPLVLTSDVLLIVSAAAMLLFCGTLGTSWTRPFRSRGGRVAVGLAAGALLLLDVVPIVRTGGLAAAAAEDGPAWAAMGLASLAALVFAVHAFVSTDRGSAAHKRSLAFMLAFGSRDLLMALAIAGWALADVGALPEATKTYVEISGPVSLLLFASLLAYGILSTQLFDIDLKLKWGIRSGTVASVLVGGFFAVYKVTEFYLGREVGWVFGGVLSGMFFFLAPRLNKFADTVANRALPKVQPTSEYISFKKLEVYRAAVESALEGDRQIDGPERLMLTRLRAKLGISDADANALEAELAGAAST